MGMFVVSTSFAYLVSYSFGKTEEEKLRELVDGESTEIFILSLALEFCYLYILHHDNYIMQVLANNYY